MANFNYTVDTKPMADEIKTVSRHINATTGAVVAMQVAVILAEEKAADHVCKNVNKGFYSLIRSQISQKMAKLQSEVDAHLMQLVQQKNALLSIKSRMQKDFNMISSRYIKLFNGLNSNLKQRIFELDKPTIDFAIKEVDKVFNRAKYLTATIPVCQLESLSSSQKIIASNVKLRGLNAIKSMKVFLSEMNSQKKLTDKILIQDSRYSRTSAIFVPVILMECNRQSNDKNYEVFVPDTELNNTSKSEIFNSAYAEVNHCEWKNNTLDQEVKSEFSRLLSGSSSSQRVKDIAMNLYQSNNYKTT